MGKLFLKNNIDFKELEALGFESSNFFGAYVRENDTGFGVIRTFINITNPNFGNLEVHCISSNWLDCVFKNERIKRLNKDLEEKGWFMEVED